MKKIVIILILLSGTGPFSLLFAKGGENFFDRLRFTETSDTVAVNLVFTNSGKMKHKIRFFEQFIQLELSPVFVEAKKSIQVNSEIVDNVQVYAFRPRVIRVRIYLKEDANRFSDNFRVRSEGKRLVLYLKKEAPDIEEVLESKIVKELDREILTALSEISSEESSVSMSLVNPKPEKEGDRQVLPETQNALASDKPLKVSTSHKTDRPALSEPDAAENGGAAHIESAPTSMQQAEGREGEKQTVTEEKSNKSIDYEIGSLLPDFFKMAGALGIVLALIFLVTAGAKKLLSQNSSLLGGGRLIRVISSTPIGVKKQITLVEVAGEVLVLGVSNENISMLMKMEQEDAVALLSSLKESERARAFSGARRVFKKKKREKPGFNIEVEKAVKTQKLAERDELINNVAKSIREKIEVLKKV